MDLSLLEDPYFHPCLACYNWWISICKRIRIFILVQRATTDGSQSVGRSVFSSLSSVLQLMDLNLFPVFLFTVPLLVALFVELSITSPSRNHNDIAKYLAPTPFFTTIARRDWPEPQPKNHAVMYVLLTPVCKGDSSRQRTGDWSGKYSSKLHTCERGPRGGKKKLLLL